jgi:exosortase
MRSIRRFFPVLETEPTNPSGLAANTALLFQEGKAFRRHTFFALFSLTLAVLAPIHLIPFISGALIYWNRQQIFRAQSGKSILPAAVLLIVGGLLYYSSRIYGTHLNDNDYVGLVMSALIVSWLGGFLLFYGSAAFKAGAFPLLFLLLTVPVPSRIMAEIVWLLQHGSASVVALLFSLTGTPAYRVNDVVFVLPGLTIEVAEACSGIRSTLGILIVTALAGHLSLHSNWKKAALVLLVIPVSLLKNAVRIVTLSLLAIHLDMSFITGNLHHEGGIFFMIFGLCLMYPVLILLMKTEKTESKTGVRS